MSSLRSRFGDGFLIVSADADGVVLPLSAVGVSSLVSPFSGWDRRIEAGFWRDGGASRNGTGGKTFSTICLHY